MRETTLFWTSCYDYMATPLQGAQGRIVGSGEDVLLCWLGELFSST